MAEIRPESAATVAARKKWGEATQAAEKADARYVKACEAVAATNRATTIAYLAWLDAIAIDEEAYK